MKTNHTQWNCKAINTRGRGFKKLAVAEHLLVLSTNKDLNIHEVTNTTNILYTILAKNIRGNLAGGEAFINIVSPNSR